MFPFDPPENIRKPKMSSGGSKGNIGKKRVKSQKIAISRNPEPTAPKINYFFPMKPPPRSKKILIKPPAFCKIAEMRLLVPLH